MFSKNPPIKKWGSKSNFFTDYFIWIYHNFSLPCPCYILCTLFLSSKWILEAVSAPKHQAWFLLPDQISFLITAASFFVLFSFFRTDFFCKNSAASSQQHFFLPIRFLFPGQIPFCKLAALFCSMISFPQSDFFSQVRFPFANWRLSFAIWFLFSRQISYRKTPPPASDLLSFPMSDSTPQIRGSLLQYDFFSPVRFLIVKLPLPLPICFLFRNRLRFCPLGNLRRFVWPAAGSGTGRQTGGGIAPLYFPDKQKAPYTFGTSVEKRKRLLFIDKKWWKIILYRVNIEQGLPFGGSVTFPRGEVIRWLHIMNCFNFV